MTLTHANRLLERAERLRRYAGPRLQVGASRGTRAHFLAEAAFWRAGGDRDEARACLAAALAWRRREKAASA